MTQCKICGRPIRFRTVNGEKFAIETVRIYFVPDKINGDAEFITASGKVTGRKVTDGLAGYKMHDCQGEFAKKRAAYA